MEQWCAHVPARIIQPGEGISSRLTTHISGFYKQNLASLQSVTVFTGSWGSTNLTNHFPAAATAPAHSPTNSQWSRRQERTNSRLLVVSVPGLSEREALWLAALRWWEVRLFYMNRFISNYSLKWSDSRIDSPVRFAESADKPKPWDLTQPC